MRILIRLLLAGFLLLGTLGSAIACGDAPYDDYVGICVNADGVRVPNEFCPVGDGIVNAGNQWSYYGYYRSTPDVVIPYVGYQVSRGWSTDYTTVHNQVTNINIHRGDDVAPPAPPKGQTGTAADVPVTGGKPQAYAGSGTVQRGGLGVQAKSVTVPGASKRTVSSAPVSRKQAPPSKPSRR